MAREMNTRSSVAMAPPTPAPIMIARAESTVECMRQRERERMETCEGGSYMKGRGTSREGIRTHGMGARVSLLVWVESFAGGGVPLDAVIAAWSMQIINPNTTVIKERLRASKF